MTLTYVVGRSVGVHRLEQVPSLSVLAFDDALDHLSTCAVYVQVHIDIDTVRTANQQVCLRLLLLLRPHTAASGSERMPVKNSNYQRLNSRSGAQRLIYSHLALALG